MIIAGTTDKKEYFSVKGVYHNEEGPALIKPNGDTYWYKDGLVHRDADQPAVMLKNGKQVYYYKNGQFHREGGPAILFENGDQEWYYEGQLHNDYGFAVISKQRGNQHWIHGVQQN